jgi:hypothetical protein
MTTSVLAVPPRTLIDSPPIILQVFEDRAVAIHMAERLSERGWDVYLGERKDEGKSH